MHERDLIESWRRGAREPAIADLVDDLHARAGREIELASPVCVASGRCCRFEEFGHRLFVTGLEAALTLERLGRTPTRERVERALHEGDCPYQVDRLCSIHPHRPLGCRLFFCDPSADAWMPRLSQELHDRLRALHAVWSIPYRYSEWRSLLAMFARHPDA